MPDELPFKVVRVCDKLKKLCATLSSAGENVAKLKG
jgi:hypothetical protein